MSRPARRRDSQPGFPPYVFLGATEREPQSDVRPGAVRGPDDLPSRLFTGDLDRGSFERTAAGWSAKWIDPTPGTWTEARYAAGLLQVSQWLEGECGAQVGSTADSLAAVVRFHMRPAPWDRAARERLTARYNLTWVDFPEEAPTFVAYPDGYPRVLLCPVPFWRLGETLDLVAALDADAGVRAPVIAELLMGQDVVGYWRARCPEIPVDPVAHYLKESEELGYPALDLPEPDASTDGQAVMIQRARYALAVTCFYRDLDRVARHLADAGFLGVHAPTHFPRAGYPDAGQWRALAGPAGLDTFGASCRLADRHTPSSRQVFLPRTCSEAAAEAKLASHARPSEGAAATARHAREQVTAIMKAAAATLDRLRAPLRRPLPPTPQPSAATSRLIH